MILRMSDDLRLYLTRGLKPALERLMEQTLHVVIGPNIRGSGKTLTQPFNGNNIVRKNKALTVAIIDCEANEAPE